MSTVQEKIDSLLALMRNAASYPNEKTQAHKALIRLCEKHGINIDDVLSNKQEPVHHTVRCKNSDEARVFAQVVFRYAEPWEDRVGFSWRGKNCVAFSCTATKYVELMAAWSVLKQAWRDEQETFRLAFFAANGLFGKRKEGQKPPELTEEERRQAERAGAMATFVKRAEIHKQLSAPQ